MFTPAQEVFIKKLTPRQLVLTSFYFSGQPKYSSIVRVWGREKKGLDTEVKKMKKERLIEDSRDEKGKPTLKLRYPKGFEGMDELIIQFPDLDSDEWDIMADTMAETKKLVKLALEMGFDKQTLEKMYKGLNVEI